MSQQQQPKDWFEVSSREPCCICGPLDKPIRRKMVLRIVKANQYGEENFYFCISCANKQLGRKEWIARNRKIPTEVLISRLKVHMRFLKQRVTQVDNLLENLIKQIL